MPDPHPVDRWRLFVSRGVILRVALRRSRRGCKLNPSVPSAWRLLVLVSLVFAGCQEQRPFRVDTPDSGNLDASEDAGDDGGAEDAGDDAGAEDAGIDAGTDAGIDAGTDAGIDAGTDAGIDAGTDA